MPDYGHPLRFGTFVTPVASPPDAAVQRAVLSERLGFDLVTFQDHPYQAAFLDTWTLLSWVAAQTSTIHVAANVHNLQLRPPAVLARAAASLDLLSGGRFELGLGAGGFSEAVVAMGGPARTPGEAVSALEEALPIIRGIWDVDEPRAIRLVGDHYSVDGAKRGPAPAHEIPIWIGALKPRMLRIVAGSADGWLPSYGRLAPGEYAAGNATIDEAAEAAGRDPREVRRLLNIGGRFTEQPGGFLVGPPEKWVDDLLALAIEQGTSTFILASDDPTTLQVFAELVVPALREAVAVERATRGTPDGSQLRSAAALAARRPGIDYDALPAALAENAVEPGDAGYRRVRSNYLRGGSPGLVLRPRDVAEVVQAVEYAGVHRELPLGVRSAGHGISGRSTNDGGLVIDVGALDTVEVIDEATRRVRVGPGAHWQDVASVLAPYGWALTSGDYGGVGVGGLATAGGVGWFAREQGLTIDHLRAAEIVLADGTVARASADENPELFWAVRGAGSNFGIVTSFEFEVDEVGDVGWAQLVFDASDTAEFLERWGAAVEASPRELSAQIAMGGIRRGQQTVAQVRVLVDSDDPDTIIELLQPFAELGPLLDQSVTLASYAAVMSNSRGDGGNGQGSPVARGGLVEHLTPELSAELAHVLAAGEVNFFQIRSVGGAVADVPEDATAYAHRSANFSIVAIGAVPQALNPLWDELDDRFLGVYLSFEADPRGDRVERAFPPATLARLRALKAEVDPQNLFRDNFNVEPASAG